MSEQKQDMLIAGGGIGGLAMALGASEANRSVHVLEKSSELGEIGAGLQLAPNALAVLDRFGLMGEIDKYAVYPNRLVLKDAVNGGEITALDIGEKFQRAYGYPYIVMHRSDLHRILLEACEADGNITLSTNQKVEEVIQQADSVKVTCANGEEHVAKSMIGADGLWSKTRKYVADDEPICSEYVAYRGTIPMSEIENHANLEDVIMWVGPNLHLVQYPVRKKELYNQVAVFKSKNYQPDSDNWGTPDELDEAFSVCCPLVKRGVEFMQRGKRWPMYDRDPIDNWIDGRMMLIGDAAHPMLQYLAQGACQALEDASYFADVLQDKNNVTIEDAFTAFQNERLPRTARVQRTARVWGEIIHAEDPITILLRDSLLKKRDSKDLSQVEWLYGYFNKNTSTSHNNSNKIVVNK